MSRLPFEAMLALRYLRPRRTFVSVITVISVVGVLVGVAVLIVVIAVMSGFDREWRVKILGFNAHLKIFQTAGAGERNVPLRDFSRVMQTVATNKNVRGVAPFVRGQVLFETQPPEGENPKFAAPLLLGVDPAVEGRVSVLPTNIVDGAFDVSGTGLIVGRDFAHGMGLAVGDHVAIYSPATIEELKKKRGKDETPPLPDDYTVRGIFDVGFADYNSSVAVASLRNAQQLYRLEEDSVHGLQVMLEDPWSADRVRRELLPALGANFRIMTWPEESPQIFNALASEKTMMFFLLFFIMVVAGFSIINSQITFVVQKTQDIGILKAIGATRRQILVIFLSQSMAIGAVGVSLGYATGRLAVHFRNHLLNAIRAGGFDPLPSSIYQLSDLPASVEMRDVLIICGAAFAACVLAGLFPAWKASRLQPVEALRYE